jgi:hypothetical protein
MKPEVGMKVKLKNCVYDAYDYCQNPGDLGVIEGIVPNVFLPIRVRHILDNHVHSYGIEELQTSKRK